MFAKNKQENKSTETKKTNSYAINKVKNIVNVIVAATPSKKETITLIISFIFSPQFLIFKSVTFLINLPC